MSTPAPAAPDDDPIDRSYDRALLGRLLVYLRPHRDTHWILLDPLVSERDVGEIGEHSME